MNRLIALIRSYAFPSIMFVMLLIALGIIAWRQHQIWEFKVQSVEHTFVIDLRDEYGWQEMDAIKKNLEQTTHQPVYGELLDDRRQVYRIKVKAPPKESHSIWDWLSGRAWVERADREKYHAVWED